MTTMMDTTVSRRSMSGLLGLLGIGALRVPAQGAGVEAMPACTMRIHLFFEGTPHRSVGMTAQVVQTRDGWQLQGDYTSLHLDAFTVPLDPAKTGEFAQLLTAALASQEPDPELELDAAIASARATLAERRA